MHLLHVVLVFCVYLHLVTSTIRPVLLNKFELGYAGYTSLLRTFTLNSTSWALVISCFNPIPFTTDSVYVVPDIGWKLTTQITPTVVTDKIIWPNGVVSADSLIEYSMIVPSGFLVPSKNNGNLYFINDTTPQPLIPVDSNTMWFYHDADFKDMDQDGNIDVVTARAHVPLVGKPTSQLIWLKNPGPKSFSTPWQVNIMQAENGPDISVQFEFVDNLQVLFTNSYFSHKLQMFWSDSNLYWNDTAHLHVRDIDSEPLSYAYVQLTMDLNGDQLPDLLVTVNDEYNGSLIAYELPPSGQIRTGVFKKHVLASGFKPIVQAKGRGAPGQATATQLYFTDNRKKPILVLSGDDDGCVYLLEALNDGDPSDWQYSLTKLHQSEKSTIGQVSVEDVDNDGNPEVFVPVYNDGQVYIYRLLSN